MKRLRVFLLLPMTIFELLVMSIVLPVAAFSIDNADKILNWSKKFPDLAWYFGKDTP